MMFAGRSHSFRGNASFSKPFVIMAAILLSVLPAYSSPAATDSADYRVDGEKPLVALVLSGGGAKGAAHIGAIKYLESLGYDFDMVVGTSMGSIIGGLYSLGYDGTEIDSLIKRQDWPVLMNDRTPRKYLTYTNKKYREKYLFSVSFDFKDRLDTLIGLTDPESPMIGEAFFRTLPSGLVAGQNIFNLFTGLSVGYQDSLDFNSFPIPFACVATDLVSGNEIVFHGGNFPTAVRASMAIPVFFAPVRVGDYILVDGGTLNNYPVDVAKSMGADIVIGVDVSGEKSEYSEINNVGDILNGVISLMGDTKYAANVEDTDVYIRPDLTGYGTMSFDRASIDTIVDRGYVAAVQKEKELKEMLARIRKEKGYSENYSGGQHLNAPAAVNLYSDSIMLASVTIHGVTKAERTWLKRNIDLPLYKNITSDDIDAVISNIYSTEAFSSVTYELVGKSNPYEMRIICKKGNAHKLGLGARFDTEEIAAVLLNAGFNSKKLTGSKYDLTLRLSMNPYFRFDYSYVAPKMPKLNFSLGLYSENADIMSNGKKGADLKFYKFDVAAYISNITFKDIDVNLGVKTDGFYIRSFLTSSDIVGDYDITQTLNSYVSAFASFRADNLDDAYFPKRGFTAGLDYSYYFTGFYKSFNPFHSVSLDAKAAIPLSRVFTLTPSLYGRFLFGNNIPFPYMNVMGGLEAGRYVDQQFAFVGTQNLNVFRKYLTAVRCDLRANVYGNHYVALMANYARDCENLKDYLIGDGYVGVGLGYSFKSMIGPLSATVFWSNYSKSVGAYVSIGYFF